jgi:ABC-type transport system involved in cytochrome c biogenesis permease subunit
MMSSLLAGGILLVSDFVSLDPYVSPLVPVLRSNYWLIVHVLTITLGYSGATLGLGLGHLWLGMYVFKGASAPELKNVENYLYRVVQVSVLFIGVGTVLGGVWANQSWGRYWGWDPKETWALISLLAFLAVVHARIVNSIAGFGTAVGTILAWQCVFFCWYGVNYFLTGLHSYAGGDQATVIPIWVYGWVIFEVVVLTMSWMCHRANTARIRE